MLLLKGMVLIVSHLSFKDWIFAKIVIVLYSWRCQKMVKSIKISLLTISVASFLFALTACACSHKYEKITEKTATYESTGSVTYRCNKCGDQYEEIIPQRELNIPEEYLADSGDPIYPLDNTIPFGLLNQYTTKENVEQYMGTTYEFEDEIMGNGYCMTYAGYELYGYQGKLIFHLTSDYSLESIEIDGELAPDGFTYDDAYYVSKIIEKKLNVSPHVGHYEGTQYRFYSDNIEYLIDTFRCKTTYAKMRGYTKINLIASNTGKEYQKNEDDNSFSNAYGTSTTICAHDGCTNYVASTGDTNCCVMHSNRCAECGKYIDEDAIFCASCIRKSTENIKKEHTCEVCKKDGTYKIIGLSGNEEYYCKVHYDEMNNMLKKMLDG